MSFLAKTRTVILGHLNELLDKTIDLDSIPVLKQYVRDLEDAIDSAKHQTAVSAAQVTTLTRERIRTLSLIKDDKLRAQAFLAQSNEAAARTVAARIADNTHMTASLEAQIATAQQQSQTLQSAVDKMVSKHDAILARVRELETKDRSSKDLEQATRSIKSAGAALNDGVDSSVDNLAQRIDARNDVAQEEFNRTAGELDTPEDPLKTKAVDDILADLKKTTTAA